MIYVLFVVIVGIYTDNIGSEKEKVLGIIDKLMRLKQDSKRENSAFTLAEVLLVLSVIGVVAALTIPTLIQKVNADQYTSKLKKEYSLLSQAFTQIRTENGGDITNNSDFACSGPNCGTSASANAMNTFATKLNVIKNCGTGAGCLYDVPRRALNGTPIDAVSCENAYSGSYGKAILADGTMLMVSINNSKCTSTVGSAPVNSPLYNSYCGNITLDVNGSAGPNIGGRDLFVLWITQSGLYPAGIYNDGFSCDASGNTWASTVGCASKIIQEGGMNY